jgi:hypothetical protein
LVLLYEAVVFVKVIRCHRTVAEGFYTFFSMVSLVVQGRSAIGIEVYISWYL